MDKSERCEVMVSPPGMWGAFQQHQCHRRAIVTRDGKRYCKIHDPEYIKAKHEVQNAIFEKKMASRRIEFSGHLLLAACKKALNLSHNPEVEKILTEVINKAEGKE